MNLRPGSFAIDGTADGGGHARAMLEIVGDKGILLCVDWDKAMVEKLGEHFSGRKNVWLAHGNYAELPEILKKSKLPKADALFLDLGFSSEQLQDSGRGFSFEKDEPLEMTYDIRAVSVAELLRQLEVRELAKIIFELSGEKFAMRIARAIKDAEKKKKIETSAELAKIIRAAVPQGYERGRIDPATRTFQALRIYANHELDNLRNVIEHLHEIVKPGGRAAIISFHSLEDRIVKQGFMEMQKAGHAEILTKKPIVASGEEMQENPRSRSAKLRAITVR